MKLHNSKFESFEIVWRYCNKVYVSTSWVIAQLHFKPSSGFKSLWNLSNIHSRILFRDLHNPKLKINKLNVARSLLATYPNFFHRKARTKHKTINNMKNITIKRAKGFGPMSRDTELGVCSLVRALNACLAFLPFSFHALRIVSTSNFKPLSIRRKIYWRKSSWKMNPNQLVINFTAHYSGRRSNRIHVQHSRRRRSNFEIYFWIIMAYRSKFVTYLNTLNADRTEVTSGIF